MMNFDIVKVENIKKKIPTMSRLDIIAMLPILERLLPLHEEVINQVTIKMYADYFKK